MLNTSVSGRSSSIPRQSTLARPTATFAATVILLFTGCMFGCQKNQPPASAATTSPVSESTPDEAARTSDTIKEDEEKPSTPATAAPLTTDQSSVEEPSNDVITLHVEENRCQADLGCDEPEQVPICSPEVASASVAAIDSFDDAPLGRQIVLDGTLLGESLACTEMGCAHLWPCCNSCFGTMSVSTPIGRVWLVDNTNLRYDIQGDESLSCVPFVTDIEVRAVGTVGSNRYDDPALLDPTVCQL